MSGVPYSSTQPQWSLTNLNIGGVSQSVFTPTGGIGVNAPSLSVGTTPALTVGTIKHTVDELLGDNIDAPITCQALLNSADTAVFATTACSRWTTTVPGSITVLATTTTDTFSST